MSPPGNKALSSAGTKTPKSVLESISSLKQLPRSTLVICKSEIRRQRFISAMFEAFGEPQPQWLAPTSPRLPGITRLQGSDLNANRIAELSQELATYSLFQTTRRYQIEQVEDLPSGCGEKILELISTVSEDVSIWLTARELQARSILRKVEAVVELPELVGFDFRRWITKEAANHGLVSVDDRVLQALVAVSAEDPDVASRVLEQLALYSEDGTISAGDVFGLFREVVDPSDFELIDRLNEKNFARSEVLLRDLLSQGKSPFMMMGLIIKTYLSYLLIHLFWREGVKGLALRDALKLTPWLMTKYEAGAKRFTLPEIQNVVRTVVTTDALLKSRSLGPEEVMGSLVQKIAFRL